MEALKKKQLKKVPKLQGTWDPKILTRNLQNEAQKPPKWRPKPSKIESKLAAKWSQDDQKIENNKDPTKKRRALHPVASFFPKMWPTWLQVGSQVGAKMDKKSIQKLIKKLMPPGIGFWKDFGGFWEGKWSQVGTKMGSKIDVNFERPILQKYL